VAARWDAAPPRALRNVRPIVLALIVAWCLAAWGLAALIAWEIAR